VIVLPHVRAKFSSASRHCTTRAVEFDDEMVRGLLELKHVHGDDLFRLEHLTLWRVRAVKRAELQ
jgi:hypothetical protein